MAVQKPKFNLRMLLAIAAILGLVAAACGNSTKTGSSTTTKASSGENVTITGVPGVTDTQIKYTVVGTGSNNPLGTCVLDCYLNGVKAYFDYRNDAGGIYGRDLVVSKTIDDELMGHSRRRGCPHLRMGHQPGTGHRTSRDLRQS
jgi:branched-chain amino acid transport system substrate-binding protein